MLNGEHPARNFGAVLKSYGHSPILDYMTAPDVSAPAASGARLHAPIPLARL
jgi:hypothetical protein